MGAVRKYHVTHNGHRTIMRLNDQDVKAYPDAELVEAQADADGDTAAKSRTAANKARRSSGDK